VVDRELIHEVVSFGLQVVPGVRRSGGRPRRSDTEPTAAQEAADEEEAAIAEDESETDIPDVASSTRRRDFDDV
jgi:hypothetical protein